MSKLTQLLVTFGLVQGLLIVVIMLGPAWWWLIPAVIYRNENFTELAKRILGGLWIVATVLTVILLLTRVT